MSFEWDPKKAAANLRKHGVRFADPFSVFEDERALTVVTRWHDRNGLYMAKPGGADHIGTTGYRRERRRHYEQGA